MTLYVAVNEQNKPVKLQTANGGTVKIILWLSNYGITETRHIISIWT
jgi:hypothetical protein